MSDVLAGISRLVQGELALARAEAKARLHMVSQAAVQLVVALVLGLTAANVLAGAAVAAVMAAGLGPAAAAVCVGVLLLAVCGGFAWQANRMIRRAGGQRAHGADPAANGSGSLSPLRSQHATA